MAEGQFVLRARAGPALEEAVSVCFVDASRSPAAFSDAIWHTFFLHACTVGLCKYVFFVGVATVPEGCSRLGASCY